jgi:magnesium chelatase family protein
MPAMVRTFALLGVEAREVGVEVDVRGGLPSFTIVGLPDAAVRESRERVRAALVNSGFEFPQKRITVNLAPANLPKAGPGFDLAIAAGVLVASEQLSPELVGGAGLAGEVALDGSIRAIPGALPMAACARRAGLPLIGVPEQNAQEAALANLIEPNGEGPLGLVEVVAVGAVAALAGLRSGARAVAVPRLPEPVVPTGTPDLAELRGQPMLRRVLEIAAAGGHSLLMLGPPGVGKSMAARRLPSILPPLGETEAIETLAVASACGGIPPLEHARRRPFRAPHHTISTAGLVGGGTPPRPGELSRAHRGVLFLDELPEFSRDALEALRQPLEDGEIAVARARHSVRLPCRVMFVAAANPCPCGAGPGGECECTEAQVRRYRARVSGPLADRIDLHPFVDQPEAGAMGAEPGETSAAVRERVCAAREVQRRRLAGRANAEMTPLEARRHVRIGPASASMLTAARARGGLSGRGHDRVLRVARTIADLAQRAQVEHEDVVEALSYRGHDRG